jgi:hypothetical protein
MLGALDFQTRCPTLARARGLLLVAKHVLDAPRTRVSQVGEGARHSDRILKLAAAGVGRQDELVDEACRQVLCRVCVKFVLQMEVGIKCERSSQRAEHPGDANKTPL